MQFDADWNFFMFPPCTRHDENGDANLRLRLCVVWALGGLHAYHERATELLSGIVSLHDHKGEMTITVRPEHSKQLLYAVIEAWEQVGCEPHWRVVCDGVLLDESGGILHLGENLLVLRPTKR